MPVHLARPQAQVDATRVAEAPDGATLRGEVTVRRASPLEPARRWPDGKTKAPLGTATTHSAHYGPIVAEVPTASARSATTSVAPTPVSHAADGQALRPQVAIGLHDGHTARRAHVAPRRAQVTRAPIYGGRRASPVATRPRKEGPSFGAFAKEEGILASTEARHVVRCLANRAAFQLAYRRLYGGDVSGTMAVVTVTTMATVLGSRGRAVAPPARAGVGGPPEQVTQPEPIIPALAAPRLATPFVLVVGSARLALFVLAGLPLRGAAPSGPGAIALVAGATRPKGPVRSGRSPLRTLRPVRPVVVVLGNGSRPRRGPGTPDDGGPQEG